MQHQSIQNTANNALKPNTSNFLAAECHKAL